MSITRKIKWDTTDKAIVENSITNLQNTKVDTATVNASLATKNTKIMFTVGLNDPSADFNTADYATVQACIQAAVSAATAKGGGTVRILPGVYVMSARVDLVSNVFIEGSGIDATILKGSWAGDYFFRKIGTTYIENFGVCNLTIDSENVPKRSGIRADYIKNFVFDKLKIINCSSTPAGGSDNTWGLNIGVSLGTDPIIRNSNGLISNCIFDNFNTTFEEVLLLNTEDVNITNCKFYNNIRSSGPGIGLYQRCENIVIDKCLFDNIKGPAIYYGLSSNYMTITNNRFLNCGKGVEGANLSDNGSLGFGRVVGLTATNNHFFGNTIGLQLGATDGAIVSNNTFEENFNIGILLNGGNAGTSASNINYKIVNNTFRRNNSENTNAQIHPPIHFTTVAGAQNCIISGNTFYDNSPGGVTWQIVSMTFYGPGTWSNMNIVNNRLESVGSYADKALNFENGGLFGEKVIIKNNFNINPDCNFIITYAASIALNRKNGLKQFVTLTGDTTITMANGIVAGDNLSLIVRQDGTGSRAVTFSGSNIVWVKTQPTLATTANSYTAYNFEWQNGAWLHI